MADIIRFREPEIVAHVGGLVDETRVTLGIHGDDLDPQQVSEWLGCPPTSAHRRGDQRQRGVPPWPSGAYLLTVEGKAPEGPDDLLASLLAQITVDPGIWSRLNAQFTVRITFGVFISQWNRGFELSAEAIDRLNAIGAHVGFDLYADLDENDG